MSRFTEPATGKCEHCGDQLLSIPGRQPGEPRRVICPICTRNALEDEVGVLRYRPTQEETDRMSQ